MEKVVEKNELLIKKTLKIFGCKKKNNVYWNEAKLYQQIINKILPIIKPFILDIHLIFALIM